MTEKQRDSADAVTIWRDMDEEEQQVNILHIVIILALY